MAQRLQVVAPWLSRPRPSRGPEMAEDQHPVEEDVEQVGGHDGDDDGPHPPHGLQVWRSTVKARNGSTLPE